ncbi:cytochrome c biogenesis CcdA family protein [Dietzia cinnamea]|uniref:Cytochrome c biogenesis protein CcdA n=1 Tax=Dietzia cinnamea TaxID=321318 RepID=A0A4R3ZRF3_9ACTN|nr:cytochrome c biogenesis CcdA family protein [Dietzia cinnamea]TCW22747.1 cytochrome c biogenesis protein CcdA [Dietzia cinnamea]
MDVGLLSAFVGGILALLSPCGALLLPAFFASTVGSGPRLWLHGAVFYAGLLVILVPLGVGAGAVGSVFVSHRETVIIAASVLLIALGLAQALGFGFDAARMLPGADALRSRAAARAGLVKTALLGAASGVAGFCAGPILGAVLTLAAAQGDVVTAGTLLAIYGAGMVVPLLVLAGLWHRIGARTRTLLRGRTVTVFGRDLHSTSVITGLLIAAIGVLFWATNGFITMPELLPTGAQAWIQHRSAALANPVVDGAVILAVAVLAFALWRRARARSRSRSRARADRRPAPATARPHDPPPSGG